MSKLHFKLPAALLALLVSLPSIAADNKIVLAHYMTCFALSPDSYKREMALSQQYGIDGWALNCGGWYITDKKTGKKVPGHYVDAADRIFQCAKEYSPDFKIVMSPDGSLQAAIDKCFETQGLRYADHPNLLRINGKPVLSGWGGKMDKYSYIRQKLKEAGKDFLLIPTVGMDRYPMLCPADMVIRQRLAVRDTPYDGIFNFSCDGTIHDEVLKNANYRFAAMQTGKLFMEGACPHYNSSNLRDFQGVLGYMAMWQGIVNDNPELVEIVTWNDYAEDTNIMPNVWSWADIQREKATFDRDETFLDLTAYYSAWYKTGVKPPIVQDKLYACYRNRSKYQTMMFNSQTNEWADLRDYALQVHDDVRDMVYLTAFLTAPAELAIVQGDKTVSKNFTKAGVASIEAPLVTGETPRFVLKRNGKVLANVFGKRQIIEKETLENSNKKGTWGNSHRVWTSTTVIGEPEYSFKVGKVFSKNNDTFVIKPKDGFKTGSYNFRIKYSNSEKTEARVTLYAEVPSMKKEKRFHPVLMPMWLPPTNGKTETLSFLLSLPVGTTELRICRDFYDGNKKKGYEGDFNDRGTAMIESIDLIRNQITKPIPAKTLPEMVRIPGGKFTIGANGKEPDEIKQEITLSPFYIGKYEVTNAEFEELMPEHREHRTALSWRDKEPVIFVSWIDAAKYCNRLSKKYGLTEYYNEKDWTLNKEANGFRMPTEAQWEYVASGRGENRIYPWGNEKPLPGVHGNFRPLKESLRADAKISQLQSGGLMIVGTYPEGASRDGVMDMAGNVAEWCTDMYHYNSQVSGTDPVETVPNGKSGRVLFRSIRGGSWGYYGGSQRVCDREFNSPVYPGYIYIGFRIALPANTTLYK